MKTLSNIIKNSNSIVFFGGAGTSTESDIPDFRSANGLYSSDYKNIPPEEILSGAFLVENPLEFFDYIRKYVIYPEAKPNKAHFALSKLEEMGKLKGIITQNIDGLHQMAGSKNVIELHGTLHKNYCLKCGASYDMAYVVAQIETIPHCEKCGGMVRPDVVLYGECLKMKSINDADDLIQSCDTLIVGGTSLLVYPAAGYVRKFKGDNLVLINKSETKYDKRADLIIREPIGEVLNKAISEL